VSCAFRNPALLLALIFSGFCVQGQTQLVLLKRETVVARWEVGDLLEFKTKRGEKGLGRIGELHDFFLVTTAFDTVRYLDLAKVRVHRRVDVTRGVGGALFMGGILYFLVDQFNAAFIIQNADPIDPAVVRASLTMVALGSALLFLKPRYQPTRGRLLRKIDSASPFYRAK
jgi:hypothetical protein